MECTFDNEGPVAAAFACKLVRYTSLDPSPIDVSRVNHDPGGKFHWLMTLPKTPS